MANEAARPTKTVRPLDVDPWRAAMQTVITFVRLPLLQWQTVISNLKSKVQGSKPLQEAFQYWFWLSFTTVSSSTVSDRH